MATPTPPAGTRPATRHSSTSERYSVQLSFVSVQGQLVSVWLLVDSATPQHPPLSMVLPCLLPTLLPALLLSSTGQGGSIWDMCQFDIADHIIQEEYATHGIFRTIQLLESPCSLVRMFVPPSVTKFQPHHRYMYHTYMHASESGTMYCACIIHPTPRIALSVTKFQPHHTHMQHSQALWIHA